MEEDEANPWLNDESEVLVRTSKKQIKLNSKSSKKEKSLEKLKQEKNKLLETKVKGNTAINLNEIEKLEHAQTVAKLSVSQYEDQDDKHITDSNGKMNENKKSVIEDNDEEEKSKKIDEIMENIVIDNHEVENEDSFKSITRNDLLQMAFAENDVFEEEFNEEKGKLIEEENAPQEEEVLPGWGSWAGKGVKKRKKKVVKVEKKKNTNKRKDAKLKNVIINERKIKKSAKLMVSEVPYPFETREQYEKSLRAPVGKEWTTMNTHKESIRPRIQTMPGKIIHPLKFTKQYSDKKEKKKRASKSKL